MINYIKNTILRTISQKIRKFKLRKKKVSIPKDTYISSDSIIMKGVSIGQGTFIGEKIVLRNDVSVGRNAILSNMTVGERSAIESGVICTGYGDGKIKIGEESYIGLYNVLDWSADIFIGNYVHIAGPSTGLWTHSSAQMCMHSIPISQKDERFRPTKQIVIEDNVYIGGNCTIYPGITIGHHSIIAPNSAVTKDVDPHTLVGGVPAKVIKNNSISNYD